MTTPKSSRMPCSVRGWRCAARLLSLAGFAFLGFFIIGEGVLTNPPHLTPNEWMLAAFFPLGVVAGWLVALVWEGLGGLMNVAAIGGFYAIHFVQSGNLPGGPFFLLMALPGVLYLIFAWRRMAWHARMQRELPVCAEC